MKKIFISFIFLAFFAQMTQGQVLISLLLGDKLNSDKLKFGLDGGVNLSTLSNTGSSTRYSTGFDLGFYFDFLLKQDKPWYIHTGVIVKSPLGADALAPYHLSNSDSTTLDSLFSSGGVDRKLRYFNVPVLVRYKLKMDLYFELGIMMGLLYKANDEFYNTIENDQDLKYENKVIDKYRRFDIGGMGGVGYHFSKGTGTDIGFRYYYGLMDIMKDNPGAAIKNSAFYFYVAIPVGAGEKAKAKAAARKKKKQEEQEFKPK